MYCSIIDWLVMLRTNTNKRCLYNYSSFTSIQLKGTSCVELRYVIFERTLINSSQGSLFFLRDSGTFLDSRDNSWSPPPILIPPPLPSRSHYLLTWDNWTRNCLCKCFLNIKIWIVSCFFVLYYDVNINLFFF